MSRDGCWPAPCWPAPCWPAQRSGGPVGAASTSSPDASALYRQAIATTHSWSVHYASVSTQASVTPW